MSRIYLRQKIVLLYCAAPILFLAAQDVFGAASWRVNSSISGARGDGIAVCLEEASPSTGRWRATLAEADDEDYCMELVVFDPRSRRATLTFRGVLEARSYPCGENLLVSGAHPCRSEFFSEARDRPSERRLDVSRLQAALHASGATRVVNEALASVADQRKRDCEGRLAGVASAADAERLLTECSGFLSAQQRRELNARRRELALSENRLQQPSRLAKAPRQFAAQSEPGGRPRGGQAAANSTPLFPQAQAGSSSSGGREVRTVIARGFGGDVQSATQAAARDALTQVVGSFMDANKILEKQTQIRDGIRSQTKSITTDIKEYSQGTIKRLDVLESRQEDGLVQVSAKVAVRVDDFRAYIKKLAEGEAAVSQGLFAQQSTSISQKDNLSKLLRERLSAVKHGEVVRFEISSPKLLSGDDPFSSDGSQRFSPRHPLENMLREYGRDRVAYILVRAYLDEGFSQDLIKTLESTASGRKRAPAASRLIMMHQGERVSPVELALRPLPNLGGPISPKSTDPYQLVYFDRGHVSGGMFNAYTFDIAAKEIDGSFNYGGCTALSAKLPAKIVISLNDESGRTVLEHQGSIEDPGSHMYGRNADGIAMQRYAVSGGIGLRNSAIRLIEVSKEGMVPLSQTGGAPWDLFYCNRRPILRSERSFYVFFGVTPDALRTAWSVNIRLEK